MELRPWYLSCEVIDNGDVLTEVTFSKSTWHDRLGIRKKYNEKSHQIVLREREKAFSVMSKKQIRKDKLNQLDQI